MQGNKKIIATLNKLLAGELAARDQYFVHARMYEDWGYRKLYERIWHEMEDETAHAAALVQRILFLGGTPDVRPGVAPNIGKDVPSMMANDLAYELAVVKNLKKAVAECEVEGDYVTRELLEGLLKDTEEDHTHWLEQQLGLIERLGLPNYLQSQL